MDNNIILWSPGMTIEAVEKIVILKTFQFYRGQKTSTANSLGIAIRTLDAKLEKYKNDGIEQSKQDAEYRAKVREFELRQRGIPTSLNASAEEQAAQRSSVIPRSDAGVRVESPHEATAQHAVPVQEPKEVQKVLPAKHGASSNGGAS